jgi:hypothetical protein
MERAGSTLVQMEFSNDEFTKEELEELQRAWKKDLGEDLSIEDARLEAHRLLSLYKVLYRRITQEREVDN